MADPTSKPVRRRPTFHTFDDVFADIDRLQAGGYERAGTWSLAQVLEHLTTYTRMSMDGFPLTLPAPVRWGGRWLAKPVVLKKRWMPAGFKAPPAFMPAGKLTDAEAVAGFRDVVRRFQAHAGPWADSPLFGKMTGDEWRQLHLIHAGHHLGFLVPKQ